MKTLTTTAKGFRGLTSCIGRNGNRQERAEANDGSDADTAGQMSIGGKQFLNGRDTTYTVPKAKTNIRITFWRRGICRPLIRGIGNTMMAISVAMLIDALENQKASLFKQWPSPTPQKNGTGTHMKTEPKNAQQP